MADRPDQDGNTFDWGQLDGWMEQSGLPKAMDLIRQPKLIESYVNDMISNAVPAVTPSLGQKKSQSKSFETHHFVFVKFKFRQKVKPEELRLFIRPDRVKVELPDGRNEEVLLPAIVLPDSCRALYKEEILQVKLRKRPLSSRYVEAYIRWT